MAIPFAKKSSAFYSFFVVWAVFQLRWRKKTYLKRRPLFCSQIFKFWCDIQGSHLIGYLWVSLIIDQSECLICYFLCSELTFFCTELTLFCTELPENCIYLNQSELRKFSMYIIRSVITKVITKIRQPLSRSLIRQLRIQLQTQFDDSESCCQLIIIVTIFWKQEIHLGQISAVKRQCRSKKFFNFRNSTNFLGLWSVCCYVYCDKFCDWWIWLKGLKFDRLLKLSDYSQLSDYNSTEW